MMKLLIKVSEIHNTSMGIFFFFLHDYERLKQLLAGQICIIAQLCTCSNDFFMYGNLVRKCPGGSKQILLIAAHEPLSCTNCDFMHAIYYVLIQC